MGSPKRYNSHGTEIQDHETRIVALEGGGGGGGEINTASNLAGGVGVFAGKVGVDLEFKSLVAGVGIGLAFDLNTITISNTGGVGESNTGSNIGGGVGVFSGKVGIDLEFKSLVAGAGIGVATDASTITITNTGGGGGGGGGEAVAVDYIDDDLEIIPVNEIDWVINKNNIDVFDLPIFTDYVKIDRIDRQVAQTFTATQDGFINALETGLRHDGNLVNLRIYAALYTTVAGLPDTLVGVSDPQDSRIHNAGDGNTANTLSFLFRKKIKITNGVNYAVVIYTEGGEDQYNSYQSSFISSGKVWFEDFAPNAQLSIDDPLDKFFQKFQVDRLTNLTFVNVELEAAGNPDAVIVAKVYNTNLGLPNIPIATSINTIKATDLTDIAENYTFLFDEAVTPFMDLGNDYWIAFEIQSSITLGGADTILISVNQSVDPNGGFVISDNGGALTPVTSTDLSIEVGSLIMNALTIPCDDTATIGENALYKDDDGIWQPLLGFEFSILKIFGFSFPFFNTESFLNSGGVFPISFEILYTNLALLNNTVRSVNFTALNTFTVSPPQAVFNGVTVMTDKALVSTRYGHRRNLRFDNGTLINRSAELNERTDRQIYINRTGTGLEWYGGSKITKFCHLADTDQYDGIYINNTETVWRDKWLKQSVKNNPVIKLFSGNLIDAENLAGITSVISFYTTNTTIGAQSIISIENITQDELNKIVIDQLFFSIGTLLTDVILTAFIAPFDPVTKLLTGAAIASSNPVPVNSGTMNGGLANNPTEHVFGGWSDNGIGGMIKGSNYLIYFQVTTVNTLDPVNTLSIHGESTDPYSDGDVHFEITGNPNNVWTLSAGNDVNFRFTIIRPTQFFTKVTTPALANSFEWIDALMVRLKRDPFFEGIVQISVYDDDGAGNPNAVIATVDLNIGELLNLQEQDFYWSNIIKPDNFRLSLNQNTDYWISIATVGGPPNIRDGVTFYGDNINGTSIVIDEDGNTPSNSSLFSEIIKRFLIDGLYVPSTFRYIFNYLEIGDGDNFKIRQAKFQPDGSLVEYNYTERGFDFPYLKEGELMPIVYGISNGGRTIAILDNSGLVTILPPIEFANQG